MSFKSSPKIPKQLSSPPPPPEHVARSEALRVIEDTMTSLAAGSKSQLIGTHMKRYYDMIRHESDASKLKHEHIFNSILLAMEMGRSRMIDRLLRCAQKLIDLGILRLDHDLEFAPVPSIMSPVATRGGAFSTPQSSNTMPSAFNLDILIDYLCNSRKLSSESTQIALLRFLHSAVASTHNQIHDYPLIKILQTCFTLAHANSKYPLVQAAAKDNLERIVYLVQYRLENHLARSNQPEGENLEIPPAPSSPSEDVPLDEMSIAATDEGDRAHLIQATRENAQVEKMCREIVNQMVESLFKPMDDTMSTFSDETTSTTTTARLPDFQFQNKDDFMLSEDAEVKSMAAPMRDAFNMFLSFSRVLQKSRSESAAEVVAFADRCQMFCLESMYQYIAQLDDASLGSPFIQKLAKNHLFPALSSTSGSTNEGIFRFSTQIMTSLFHKARSSFKFELAAFLLHHHIRILESANAPDKHRILVLESLKRLSSEPEFPVELYMNYDCEIDQPNVFHTLVEALDKVIRQVGPKVEDPDIHSDVTFRAMEILTLLLDGLSKWMKKGKPIPDQSSEGQIESLALEETEPTPKDFEAKKKQKDVFAKCVEEFNRKPKKGIASFVANEFLQDSPEQIAHFLRHTSALDKVALGEYLGEGEEHNISILEHFTASFDFRNLTFDAALRYYLTTFRLPGEAQKISRVLEFFSERFCLDNPNLFSSKDTAYVLAYSVIMLNTDAHNPMVKKKMSLEEFVRNNRGIDNGKDLPHALLEQLYRSIVSNGIKMKEMEEPKGLTGLSAARKRLVVYEWESERSSQKILEMITGRHADPHSSFHPAVYADFTRLIFSSIWHVVIGALNHRLMRPLAMEDPRLPSYIASVMDAFKYSIRICVACSLTTERTVFLNAYINFFPVNEAKGNRRGESSDRANAPAHPSEAIRTILVDDVVVDEKFMKAYFPTAKAGKAEYSRLQENLEKMALIQKSFIGRRKIKVFDPMRRFIREGPVKFLSNGKLKDRYIFLFDDCLICASLVPTDSDRLYFMHSLLFLSQCKLTEEMIENNPMLQISHPEKTFIFCCDSAPQQKIWMTDLEKAIGVSADFLKASETTVQSAFQSLVSAVTCLNFECEKPNRKSSEMERRVMQIDYGQQKLHNILRGTIRKSFAFVDIISCERDPLTETVVSIVLRNSVMYEIHADTREERDEMAEAIQDLISYNSKAVPAKVSAPLFHL
eukprot:TRINITY_DN1646_c0_g1_i13.p1 TRINITY_DN1646_c0_g1~~TRINITY_DN1646_c0_g1_i13.p1  ORF type:complete len:1215 (-),score=306.59 TRINITY_DN1646_c0_g1_i13:1714-5358(-)